MAKPVILVLHSWLPENQLGRWSAEFTACEFVDGRSTEPLERHLQSAVVIYGLPPVNRIGEAASLRWIQLASAGVPQDLCPPAKTWGITVTNLAGLYGPTIAEHALAMMLILSRHLQIVLRSQAERRWDRGIANTMADLHGKTLSIVGLGNIGQNIARLARAFGMRVVGCRRTGQPTPYVDRVYPLDELRSMLAEGDYVAVAAPLTAQTQGMLGAAEFAAMKRGTIYINVSRGAVAEEQALLGALQSGRLAGAGLDVFAVEPVPTEHPFWSMPNVLLSPHYSGETVNLSALPAERFTRNLHNWLAGRDLEGLVNLELGY